MIEWLGADQRILASLVLGIPLAAGSALLALLDRLLDSWRLWARSAYPPSLLIVLYIWLLPEGARWLAARGRHAEAAKALRWAAVWNRKPVPLAALDKAREASRPLEEVVVKQEKEESLIAAIFR